MKRDKISGLLKTLSGASKSIPTSELAYVLGVSDRSVRNYIKEINEEGIAEIKCDRDGYYLNKSTPKPVSSSSENRIRLYTVISALLNNEDGADVFAMAESLSISSSTVTNTIIPKIKDLTKKYNLKVESCKFCFRLVGSEKDKRRMIQALASNYSYGFLNSKDTLHMLFPASDVDDIMQLIYDIFSNTNFFLNDYALNNLLLHLTINLIRIKKDFVLQSEMSDDDVKMLLECSANSTELVSLANRISMSFREKYEIIIPPEDYKQILVLLAFFSDHTNVAADNIVTGKFLGTITAILDNLSRRYDIPAFSDSFIQKFSIHMFYTWQRCAFDISYQNPIGAQFKKDYALVYDMSVAFSQQFSEKYNVTFSEDEIAYIAFHIGTYLDNLEKFKDRISCVVIMESYNQFSDILIKKLREIFFSRLYIKEVMALNRYLLTKPSCDLLISTVPFPENDAYTIMINPILTSENQTQIQQAIEALQNKKIIENSKKLLQDMLHSELYFRNIDRNCVSDYIEFMCDECVKNGYAKEEFKNDVLLRESISSTAFSNAMAVPHAITRNTEKSFICVLHHDAPIDWDGTNVNFVFLIGISEDDMKYFREAFMVITDLFRSPSHTIKLLGSNTFEEFCSKLLPE